MQFKTPNACYFQFLTVITTSLHQTGEFRLQKIVVRLKDNFDSKELDNILCILGKRNVADALTKHNLKFFSDAQCALCA